MAKGEGFILADILLLREVGDVLKVKYKNG